MDGLPVHPSFGMTTQDIRDLFAYRGPYYLLPVFTIFIRNTITCVVLIQSIHFYLGGMFKVDPRERPNINEIIERLQEIAVARNVNLKAPLTISEVILNNCK